MNSFIDSDTLQNGAQYSDYSMTYIPSRKDTLTADETLDLVLLGSQNITFSNEMRISNANNLNSTNEKEQNHCLIDQQQMLVYKVI